MSTDFDTSFEELTGNPPCTWQAELYARFLRGDLPSSCKLPTGLGKSSITAIWLLALATQPRQTPRRLIYVVNRRTVVDQTTTEVERYCEAIHHKSSLSHLKALVEPLRISTLRGQFVDNQQWSADPSRPAVICGTVDMIGSRLLFRGYRIGFKSKPLHAAFLAQDTLLVGVCR